MVIASHHAKKVQSPTKIGRAGSEKSAQLHHARRKKTTVITPTGGPPKAGYAH